MSYSKFAEELLNEFYVALEAKTNWERGQLKTEFEGALIRVLSRYLERMWEEKDADTK